MLLSKLLEGVEYISCNADLSADINNLTSDSRKAQEGVVFVCIPGVSRDGHDFAPAAASQGAQAIVCERDLGLDNQIVVKSSREAFAAMCENYFGNPLKSLKLIGITGTNGKTSTTYILKHILEECGHKCGLVGTIRNMIGQQEIEAKFTTPDTYDLHSLFAQMAQAGCEYCIMEVSSHALAQGRVTGLHFEVGCFTNLTQDHLDFHHTMQEYFEAKCIMLTMSSAVCLNADDEWWKRAQVPQNVRAITYGMENSALSLCASDARYAPDGVRFSLSWQGKTADAYVPIPGKFSVYNALSAVSCALALGEELDAIEKALASAQGVKGRAEVYPTGRDFSVIIDYAHTPDGVSNILTAMREVSRGRLVCIVGCGGDRDAAKRPIMGSTAAQYADFVVITSDNPRSEEPMRIIEQILPGVKQHDTPYVVIENRRDAIEYALRNAQKDDVIVLAGKGHETYQILSTGTIHFDEREVLGEILAQMQ